MHTCTITGNSFVPPTMKSRFWMGHIKPFIQKVSYDRGQRLRNTAISIGAWPSSKDIIPKPITAFSFSTAKYTSLRIHCKEQRLLSAFPALTLKGQASPCVGTGPLPLAHNELPGPLLPLQPGLQWSFARVLLPFVSGALQPLLRTLRVLRQWHLHRADQPHVCICRKPSWMVRAGIFTFSCWKVLVFLSQKTVVFLEDHCVWSSGPISWGLMRVNNKALERRFSASLHSEYKINY